jgi:hypothetical protein
MNVEAVGCMGAIAPQADTSAAADKAARAGEPGKREKCGKRGEKRWLNMVSFLKNG